MIGIFLDDERHPSDVSWVDYKEHINWHIIRRPADFLFAIYNVEGEFVVYFDNDLQAFDLAGNEETGYTLLKQMIDYCIASGLQLPKCYFHTQNPIGKQNMECYYKNSKRFMEKI